MIYLDHAATTPDSTRNTTNEVWNFNPNSIYPPGLKARNEIKDAEKIIKDEINGHDGEIIWTGSGSQANFLAINTICSQETLALMTTAIEHKSIRQIADNWHLDLIDSARIKPDKLGLIDPIDINEYLSKDSRFTELVSIHWVNNETGIVQPIPEIGVVVQDKRNKSHRSRLYFHSDAVQAFGKVKIDVVAAKVDMLTISAHKIYGPKGIGALWVSNRVLNDPDIKFPYQGTPSPELIARFACAVLFESWDEKKGNKIAVLEDKFLHHLEEYNVEYELTASYHRLVGHLSLHFPNVDADELLLRLSDKGVYVSTGSACNEGEVKPSHVLTAMGIPPEQIASTIRITLGNTNNYDQMQQAAEIISLTIKEIKNDRP